MDDDGDLDIAAGAYGRHFARNHLEQLSRAETSFLRVRVEDDDGRLVEHGATVRLRSLDDPRHPVQTRIVDGGSGYLGQDEYTVTFGGVGSGRYDLEVSFPSTPDNPNVVGPAQNPMLGGIRPGGAGPKLVVVRPNSEVTFENRDPGTAGVEPPLSGPLGDLRPAAPNPARRMTRLDFSSPIDDAVTLTIHDVSGRNVRTLIRNGRGADGAGATWDLSDDGGRAVPAGLYLARLVRKDGRASVRRVIVVR
jgi:ASPIC/UnbV protein